MPKCGEEVCVGGGRKLALYIEKMEGNRSGDNVSHWDESNDAGEKNKGAKYVVERGKSFGKYHVLCSMSLHLIFVCFLYFYYLDNCLICFLNLLIAVKISS